MSPQTFPTITRDGRKAASAARSRARAGTVLRHEMTVVGSNVVDVVASTGGWLYDQVGFTRLVFISAGFTAFCWLLVPLLRLEGFELGRKKGPYNQ